MPRSAGTGSIDTRDIYHIRFVPAVTPPVARPEGPWQSNGKDEGRRKAQAANGQPLNRASTSWQVGRLRRRNTMLRLHIRTAGDSVVVDAAGEITAGGADAQLQF